MELGLGGFYQSFTKPGVPTNNDPLWKRDSAALFTVFLRGVTAFSEEVKSEPRPTQRIIQPLSIEQGQRADSGVGFLNLG